MMKPKVIHHSPAHDSKTYGILDEETNIEMAQIATNLAIRVGDFVTFKMDDAASNSSVRRVTGVGDMPFISVSRDPAPPWVSTNTRQRKIFPCRLGPIWVATKYVDAAGYRLGATTGCG